MAEISDAFQLLSPLLGASLASTLFACALLASGQNSTLTGTLAGQIVMEGFLEIRLKPWLRRLITRSIAILPAALVIGIAGESKVTALLILSQVVLSFQLPFAVIPLVQFTSNRKKMGEMVNSRITTVHRLCHGRRNYFLQRRTRLAYPASALIFENHDSRRPISNMDPQKTRKLRRLLFIALLGMIVVAVVLGLTHRAEWIIPDEAARRQNPIPPSAQALEAARPLYNENCARCHGDKGDGHGPDAWKQSVSPSDFTNAARMNSLTDGALFYQISEGRRPMPQFQTRLPEHQRWQLVQFLRTFSTPMSAPTPK